MNNDQVIMAATHTPEYLLHKYWSRKPHNVISMLLEQLVPRHGLIIDPFCGSGVVLHEANKAGIDSIGCDVNPIAILISKVLIEPPNANDLINTMTSILDNTESQTTSSYSVESKSIRYLTHRIIVKCSCGLLLANSEAKRIGRTYYCPQCNGLLRFNLENLIDTRIEAIELKNGEVINDQETIRYQEHLSKINTLDSNMAKYDYKFVENRRILAFKGIKTSDLFTTRNFSILCSISDMISSINDDTTRNAARLLLTASSAQCSRLIASRNNLSTGGPAWTIPGYWVPATHLETNPIIHIRARLSKFIKGIELIRKHNIQGKTRLIEGNATDILASLEKENIKADLVFLDPPYGDSVPYLEFSALWNSFLRDMPDPDIDISVSNRITKQESWTMYGDSLLEVISNSAKVLKDSGVLLITFNNNEIRAWKSLIGALQSNDFICSSVRYQAPSVIPSKAQMAKDSSYISDIYSVYIKGKSDSLTNSLKPVVDSLIRCASVRGGIITKSMAQRVAMVTWMKNNICSKLLDEIAEIINSTFKEKDGRLQLKEEIDADRTKDIAVMARELADEYLSLGPCDWVALYNFVAARLVDYGTPEPIELAGYLDGILVVNKTRCISTISKPAQEMPLQLKLGL